MNNLIISSFIKYIDYEREVIIINKILTKREQEIFELLIDNKTAYEVADILNISDGTVRNHISNVIQKLSVKTRYQALIELIKSGDIKL